MGLIAGFEMFQGFDGPFVWRVVQHALATELIENLSNTDGDAEGNA